MPGGFGLFSFGGGFGGGGLVFLSFPLSPRYGGGGRI